MKKLFLFLLVFFLALFVFNSQAFACNSKPKIYSVVQDPETGELLISGKHLKNSRVKLGGKKLKIVEATHDNIRAIIPEEFKDGGSFRLGVYRKIKYGYRWWRRYRWRGTHMDITLVPKVQQVDSDPTGKGETPTGDTTPPEILNPMGPSQDPAGFLETHVLISFDVIDDNEIAFIGIQNVALPTSKTVYAPLDTKNWSISEEIATTPGDNTIVIVASDICGNITQNAEIQFHRVKDCPGCNLRGLHMRGADFYGANLAGAILSDADLSEANLSEANLSKDGFGVRACLIGAKLTNANLYHTNMDSAKLFSADLSGADLRNAILTSTIMIGANLRGADLQDAVLTGANLKNANLTGANLTNATVEAGQLEDAFLNNTICPNGTNSDDVNGVCP